MFLFKCYNSKYFLSIWSCGSRQWPTTSSGWKFKSNHKCMYLCHQTNMMINQIWFSTHRHVKQPADGCVISCTTVGHGYGVHARSPEDGVLVAGQALYQGVRFLQPAVHGECYTDGETPQDLLVLGLLSILKKQNQTLSLLEIINNDHYCTSDMKGNMSTFKQAIWLNYRNFHPLGCCDSLPQPTACKWVEIT